MSLRPWPTCSAAGARLAVRAGCRRCVRAARRPASRRASSSAGASPEPVTVVRHVDMVDAGGRPAAWLGARCPAGDAARCTCRKPGDDAENEPPAEGQKRLEIRLSVDGGEGALRVAHPRPVHRERACTKPASTWTCPRAARPAATSSAGPPTPTPASRPRLTISEYGPEGPYWYEIFAFECVGVGGRCDRAGADAWGARPQDAQARTHRSLRLAGGDRPGLGDLGRPGRSRRRAATATSRVRFDVEVKKFATQFAPALDRVRSEVIDRPVAEPVV